ncbi:helix-turn-helix domain-containing protein, partial [Streptomyces sp. ZG43]
MGTADSTGAAAQLAALLSTLKERSGLSYGALGKRLHLSASTLHRYCNGDAVPADFAPLNRFARLCRATPEELVEVHRRWILADAARAQRGKGAGGGAGGVAPAADSGTPADTPDADRVPKSPDVSEGQKTSDAPPSPRPRRRLVLAATACVVAVASVGALL